MRKRKGTPGLASKIFPNLSRNFGVQPVSMWYRRFGCPSVERLRWNAAVTSASERDSRLGLLPKVYSTAWIFGVSNRRTRHVRPDSPATNGTPRRRARSCHLMNAATLDLPLIDFPQTTASLSQRVRRALAVLLMLSMFTGALFLGWGWDDLLQLFSHPARATLLVALMFHLAISVARARPLPPPTDRAAGRFARILFWVPAIASLSMVASSAFWDRRILFVLPGEDVTRYVGLGLFLVGLAINAWQPSMNEIQRGYVSIAGRSWFRNGIFGLFGGPCQAGLIVAAIGLPMVFLSKLGLAGGTFFAALMVARMIWRARTFCVNDGSSERRLEAA